MSKDAARPTIHLLYGFVGAGKSTFARQLEQRGEGVLLSVDDWIVRLYGANPPAEQFQVYFDRVWALILEESARFLRHRVNVILDRGFWSRASRDEMRAFAAQHNAITVLYHITAPDDVLRRRVSARNATATTTGNLIIDDAAFDDLRKRFEPLGSDEPAITVVTA